MATDPSNPVTTPRNVAEAEVLVKRLYESNPPAIIQQINDQLQALQISAHGWQLGDELLASGDANVRFFGALTFMVKLTREGWVLLFLFFPDWSRWSGCG